MKKFTIALLSTIFVALIACSVQSISADHLEPGPGIFLDENEVELVSYWTTESTTMQGSSYQVYLQTVLRNGDGQLISVTESTATGAFIDHELTDHVFDTLMGQKEIVVIDNIKYEKIQYTNTLFYSEVEPNVWSSEFSHYRGQWVVRLCGEFDGHGDTCIPIFQVNTSAEIITKDDVVINQWTILREIN